ncbi:hypothetical protein B4U80_14766, partial [Leptotrombidium deliense]
HKWVRMDYCVKAKWHIHGLWMNTDKGTRTLQKHFCNSDRDDRRHTSKVTSSTILPDGYAELTFPISATFRDLHEWLDYMWCSHGFFLDGYDQTTGKHNKMFASPFDYFNLTLRFYHEIRLNEKLQRVRILPSDTFLNRVAILERLMNSFDHKPGFKLSTLS